MIYDKLVKKVILVLIFSLISCIIFTNTTFASSLDNMISSADAFLQTGQDNAINTTALKSTSDYIYNTLLVIAVAVAVIVGTYLGIKFMMESAEDKAKIKESLIPFVVGCFIIFGAFGIWKIAVNVGNKISGNTTGLTNSINNIKVADSYVEWKSINGIKNDDDAVGWLQNMNFSNKTTTEKEKYKKIVDEAIVVFNSYRGDKSSQLLILKHIQSELGKELENTQSSNEVNENKEICNKSGCDNIVSAKSGELKLCNTHYALYVAAYGEPSKDEKNE